MPEFLQAVASRLGESASAKSVFGEPVAAHGRTVIPVARVFCGLGGGAGEGRLAGHGQGEGGGGGLWASPLGVFEVTETGTRFVPLHDTRKLALVGFACFWLGMLFRTGRRK